MDGDKIFENWILPAASAAIMIGVALSFLGVGIWIFRASTGW